MIIPTRCWTPVILAGAVGCGAPPDPVPPAAAEGRADVIYLSPEQQLSAGLEIVTVDTLPPDTVHLTGSVTFDAARVSHVGPRMQGRLLRVPVEIGSPVRTHDTLAVLDSPELGAAQARWFSASIERDVDRRNSLRTERLFRDGIVSERRRLEAEAEYRRAEGDLAAALQTLAALGAEPDSSASSRFVLFSPLSGIVADKHATVGEVVGSDDRLFTVADLTRLWILLDVYEADLPRVVPGAPVGITTEAYRGRRFTGRVGYVGAMVDTTSRTVKVRVEIPNRDLALKPGMFTQAALVLHDAAPLIGIPERSVQQLDGRSVVFVPADDGEFRIVSVVLGARRAGGWLEVKSGLAAGDTVVNAGSFAIKAEFLKDIFGEEEHE